MCIREAIDLAEYRDRVNRKRIEEYNPYDVERMSEVEKIRVYASIRASEICDELDALYASETDKAESHLLISDLQFQAHGYRTLNQFFCSSESVEDAAEAMSKRMELLKCGLLERVPTNVLFLSGGERHFFGDDREYLEYEALGFAYAELERLLCSPREVNRTVSLDQ